MPTETWLRAALSWVLLFLAVTGCVTLAFDHPPPGVQALQLAHFMAGVAAAVLGALYLLVHVRQTLGSVSTGRSPLARAALRLGSALVGLVGLGVFIPDDHRPILNMAMVLTALTLVAVGGAALVRTMLRGGSVVAHGTLLAFLAFVMVTSGFGVAVGANKYATGIWDSPYHFHLGASALFVVLGGVHVLGARRRASAGRAEPRRHYPWRRPLSLAALPALALFALGTWALAEHHDVPRPELMAAPSPIQPTTQGTFERMPASCRSCHDDVVNQWDRSSHHLAAANPLFESLLDRVDEHVGAKGTRFCLGCHAPHAPDPIGVPLSEIKQSAGFAAGVHCISCHRTTPGETGRDGDFVMHPMAEDPFAFVTDAMPSDSEAKVVPWVASLVTSRLDAHRRQFRFASRTAESCQPCHVQTIDVPTGGRGAAVLQDQYDSWHRSSVAKAGTDCKDCHARRYTNQSGYLIADHRFLGASTYLARHAGGPAQVAEVVAHLEGRDPFPPGAAFPTEARPLLTLDVALEGRTLAVTTRSGGTIGHSFPNGPTDLFDVWLAVSVRDASGRLVLDVGQEGPDAQTPRLGHQLLDASGRPITDHRLDRVDRVVDLGHVPTDGTHHTTVALPQDPGPGPLTVDVRWCYRRIAPERLAELTGETEPLPIAIVGRFQGEVSR